ncbi:reverse transcriptase domain-containing protein [Pectobacterium brasiliense]|uniref:RNA-dependent DNA polymerase n=1 Tax=Pectobacterium brasiliense TaxID=180957 RepID=A0ABS2WWH8_9GAMM|nr:reverse transcriptase domain-containing protein [Pectobacterium brasiliense]GKW28592.1 reverse transcriptase [Pectobacterium carotovorum subsp. carotovorum]MBN3085409.1 RNA-dependent DNA polymerase [Pectobacterium brasiliense]MBN3104848.1 RNA-dependent DNA polymerase [Pectobacterium brasiliense]MBN3109004.1 RNA-dependent DNA polymerase [Pectobacterium brasiliense]MBN3201746.1 RNA-dependent DNA polymerase [Pectobacterium brasiliense]
MSSFDVFQKHFKIKNLRRIYKDIVSLSSACGVDNMTHEIFWRFQKEEIKTIRRKCLSGDYNFNKYKLKLISKGRGKAPREISIPTIRDKIALRAICDFLQEIYQEKVVFDLPQDMIVSVKDAIDEYDYFMKFDVANFYPSVVHDKLISRLRAKIRDERILSLIKSAISSATVSKPKRDDLPSERGVPQGLSISNILAAIYLLNIDDYFRNNPEIKYYRYVDDVMILCDSSVAIEITSSLISRFRRLGLNVYDPRKNPEKSSVGYLGKSEFGYLGYYFLDGKVTARKGSVENLRESLLAIFTGYKHSTLKSPEFLEWRINLRITGCIFQNKSKGWMYFFSEIDDETLLHELDGFLKRLCERFSVSLNLKSFVRTFYQIRYNRRETSYIPNFDEYDLVQKSHILTHYFKKNVKGMTDEEIEYHFNKRISKQVKDIETDIKDAGY